MPTYRVLLHGSDFRLDLDGEVRAVDLFATRWYEADDEPLLEKIAIEAFSEELQDLVEEGSDPHLYLEEAIQAESEGAAVDAGISWFPHDDEEAGFEARDGEFEAYW